MKENKWIERRDETSMSATRTPDHENGWGRCWHAWYGAFWSCCRSENAAGLV